MSEVKTKEKGEKRKRPKGAQDPNHCDVDCTNSELKLWLVKGMFHLDINDSNYSILVPKYLGQKWLDSPSTDVGKLAIRRTGARTEVTFKLNQTLAQSGDPSPVDHKLMLSGRFPNPAFSSVMSHHLFCSTTKARNTWSFIKDEGRSRQRNSTCRR